MPSTRRALLTAGVALLAGCAGVGSAPGTTDTSTDSGTPRATPSGTSPRSSPDATPAGEIDFPEGPKSPPDRPAELTRETVREYVRTYERRYAYNALYDDEGTEVSLTCEVLSVEAADPGYRAVVRCSGYSETRGSSGTNGTATVVHADWGSRRFRYRVTEGTTTRRPVER
ncbi:MAG: hypothetical protein ABEJ61_07325 [Haloferacaceae archaeon]